MVRTMHIQALVTQSLFTYILFVVVLLLFFIAAMLMSFDPECEYKSHDLIGDLNIITASQYSASNW